MINKFGEETAKHEFRSNVSGRINVPGMQKV